MLDKETKRKIIFDVILVTALLVIALFAYFAVGAFRTSGAYALVTVNGEEEGIYPLSRDGEYSLNGGTNILVIEDGVAYIREADCPDGLCVRKGKVYLVGDDITCLPNRVRVEIFE